MDIVDIIIVAAISYLAGSIPFGLLLAKAYGYGDIRNHGSGNIGATNAMRIGGKMLGASTLLLDALKGWLPVYCFSHYYGTDALAAAALFAVLGHIAPVWLGFNGGKGVAIALAVFTAMNIWLGLIAVIAWLIIFTLTKISSVASLVSITIAAVISFFICSYLIIIANCIILLIIIYRHKKNIISIFNGTEYVFKR